MCCLPQKQDRGQSEKNEQKQEYSGVKFSKQLLKERVVCLKSKKEKGNHLPETDIQPVAE